MDALVGALLARAAASIGGGPTRPNYRGREVSLAGGPALSVAATLTAATGAVRRGRPRLAAAAVVAGGLAGVVGRYDDVVGGRAGERAKGFAGHLGALRSGRLTSGVVKLVGLSLAGLAASALVSKGADTKPARGKAPGLRRVAEAVAGAGVIAGTANLLNLLDLRPGRALKAGLLLGAPLIAAPMPPGADPGAGGAVVAGPLGAAMALLPADLAEETMLGDCGANSLGALLGLGLVARTGLTGRAVLLAGLAAISAVSERVSFSRVFEETPALRRLDRLGRSAP